MTHPAGPIVVFGAHLQGLEMRVDAVPREGETVLAASLEEGLDGGKATSQAVAACRLGAAVELVTVIGSDERGERWLRFFEQEGLGLAATKVVDGPTDVGVTMLPPSGIPAIASGLVTNRRLDVSFVHAARAVIESAGVLVCQLECPTEAVAEALRIAHRAGVLTVLNPAPVTPLGDRLLADVDVLVPNEHEASALTGVDDPREAARLLALRYPHVTLVVTLGGDGVLVAERGGSVREVPAPAVEVVDTTGAGDAFVGALASRLAPGADALEAVEFAVRAASLSVTRAGTIPSIPRLTEVAI